MLIGAVVGGGIGFYVGTKKEEERNPLVRGSEAAEIGFKGEGKKIIGRWTLGGAAAGAAAGWYLA